MNTARITYTWGQEAPPKVRHRIEAIFQCVPKRARVIGLYFLFEDDKKKDFYTMEVELEISRGAIGIMVEYEEPKN